MSQDPLATFSASSAPALGDPGGPSVASAHSSEKATTTDLVGSSSPRRAAAAAGAPTKPRSCVTCRSRKVRCDKASPCSNCRRAGIACVFPSLDRPPRWARRLERITQAQAQAQAQFPQVQRDPDPNVDQVMDRLRNLEGLVKELSSQLEEAHTAGRSAKDRASSSVPSRGSPTSSSNLGPKDAPSAGHHPFEKSSASSSPPTGSSPANTSNIQGQFGRLVVGDANRSRYVSSGFWSRVNDEVRMS